MDYLDNRRLMWNIFLYMVDSGPPPPFLPQDCSTQNPLTFLAKSSMEGNSPPIWPQPTTAFLRLRHCFLTQSFHSPALLPPTSLFPPSQIQFTKPFNQNVISTHQTIYVLQEIRSGSMVCGEIALNVPFFLSSLLRFEFLRTQNPNILLYNSKMVQKCSKP